MQNSKLSEILVTCGVVTLRPEQPFTFSSGIKSPIYCDHRVLLSFVKERAEVIDLWAEELRREKIEQIAAVSTAGIPWGAWLADRLELPMLYVRSKPKDYGQSKLIEGTLNKNLSTGVIEDLISTGKSSLTVLKALREEGCQKLLVSSVFNYGFHSAIATFEQEKVGVKSLLTLSELLGYSLDQKKLSASQVEAVKSWQKSPDTWS